ncbi:MAG: hypothetical protein R3244_04980, partial [Thermoanaerobaculia bacterium]|nr:hypothetical protein [Thermoanaerobaculia bacterium]
MSGEWFPVLLVLALGSLAGLLVAWWMRRSRRAASSEQLAADAALRLKDLERRKRELYERLEGEEDAADRQLLEDQAARVLREIDRLRGELPAAAVAAAEARVASAPAPAAASSSGAPSGAGRPMMIGFFG